MSAERRLPVSVPWAIAVPAIAWWPIVYAFVELRRPQPGEPGIDLNSLLYLPAAVAWLPMIAVASLAATWVGHAMARRGVAADGRRRRGLWCGVGALLFGIAVLGGVALFSSNS